MIKPILQTTNRNVVKIVTQCRFIEHQNKYKLGKINRAKSKKQTAQRAKSEPRKEQKATNKKTIIIP